MKENKSVISVIVGAAADKCGSLAELHRELIRREIRTSYQQLSSAVKHMTKSVDSTVLIECMEIGFDGDWNKARKVLRSK